MTYIKKEKAFNLTATKLKHWHHYAKHINNPDCIFCTCDMYKIAEFLKEQGFEVLDVGHAWVKIKAEKNYKPFHGGTTDEINLLFNIISGKKAVQDQVKIKTEELRKNNEPMICPQCGKTLKVRNGPYGFFLGCTGYPKCRYTKNI
ncbi:Topoisomerase DNA binding C4 zinc finger [Desulforamulus putei DSM 12395]|uniref:Topoisomerase DNA binding C4 zinc finger n=1 Tax=Desulforamulus putei DSM 12395 TaxID=1121429 RepID=A0A1M4ZAN7_9FIRM|nr:topoisomerase DNA-binding C4 zinc finger domain-containing protein [Desulforamulus putei]SHF15045.1 Topoisomerase DNA binding C4 zinc finger [Desulforamulus putei DSM 12395]